MTKAIKRIGFYILTFTWGLPMTLIGCVIALGLLVSGHKPHLFHFLIYFEVGQNWGGVNYGCFLFVCKESDDSLKRHESGHSIQNILLGFFMPFVVGIPSLIRYWYREYLVRSGKKKYSELPPYDSMWCEGWATKLGDKYFK